MLYANTRKINGAYFAHAIEQQTHLSLLPWLDKVKDVHSEERATLLIKKMSHFLYAPRLQQSIVPML